MSDYRIVVNYYKRIDGGTGHWNLTFIQPDGTSETYGNNLKSDSLLDSYDWVWKDDEVLPTLGLQGGIKDESNYSTDYTVGDSDNTKHWFKSEELVVDKSIFDTRSYGTEADRAQACLHDLLTGPLKGKKMKMQRTDAKTGEKSTIELGGE